jgi:hypothetical protein
VYEQLVEPLLASRASGRVGRIEVIPTVGIRVKRYPHSSGNFVRAMDAIRGGEADLFECTVAPRSDEFVPPEVAITVEVSATEHSEIAHQVTVLAYPEVYEILIGSSFPLRDVVVQLAKGMAVGVRAATGAVGRSAGIGFSNEEAHHGGGNEIRQASDRYVRGMYWGLFLGETQLTAPGGLSRVIAEAPVAETLARP